MSNTMEELLSLIAGVDDEEDILVKITETESLGNALQMRAEVSVDDGSQLGAWIIRCEYALAYRLTGERKFSLELTDDHPLLWKFKYPNASAFFNGVPVNSDACVGALYVAHERAVGAWIPFAHLNNARRVSELLATGNGLLARGPVALLKVYKEALLSYGVEISIVGEYQPKFWDGAIWMPLEGKDVKALLLGGSYVVGIGWTATQSRRSADTDGAATRIHG